MGTHPIFESDFDCLTEKKLNLKMHELDLEVPFESARHAEIALNSLVQDKEPRSGSGIQRDLTTEKNILRVKWKAEEARILRTSVTSLLQLLTLVTQTMEKFDGLE